jgi:cytochrome P450
MDDRRLRDEIVTMFLAGHETTAIALTAALYLLARHPEEVDLIRRETDEVLGGRPAGAADLARLRRTDAVVREAMRLYPPAWIIGREASRELRLADGTVIPAGGQILLSQWVVHRDARWFAEPERFRPERWLDGSTAGLHRYAYFPFGGGPRVCIGNHFAMLEAVVVLATLVDRLDLAALPSTRLDLEPAVTLRPTGPVELAVTPRARHA